MKLVFAKKISRITFMAMLVVLISACATTAPPPEERNPADPWEPFNRNMYSFNRAVDKAILRPVARGYSAITPDPVERGISNVFDNVQSVPVILNLLLQGEPADAGRMFERFFVNTIFGLAGIFDVATQAGLPDYDEDFGQTLAIWGWDDSRYLVLPLLGPSTLRDSLGRPVDAYASYPWNEATDGRMYLWGINLVDTRARLLPREAQLEEAFDEYLFVRDAWLQRRDFLITGESETPDYEAFLDEEEQ